jgi:hypothetical protein
MNEKQLELLNEIKVKMFYDPRKTLSEQSVVGAPDAGVTNSSKPSVDIEKSLGKEWEDTEIYPIPGYKPFVIPKINNPEGGYGYMYLPEESEDTISYIRFVSCEDFQKGEFCNRYSINTENLQKIYPPGAIKSFEISTKKYIATIGWDPQRGLVFLGYRVRGTSDYYVSPNPEDFKTDWEKWFDKYGTVFQIVGSVVALAAISYFTGGMALPVAYRLGLEILVEAAINIPVALYEYKKGNEASGNLSLMFSLLPLIQLPPLKGISKETLESISQKLSQTTIESGSDVAKFYDEALTETEKYAFSRVMKQDPYYLKKMLDKEVYNLIKLKSADKNFLKKILFKNQNWWKELGLQFPAAIALVLSKNVFGEDVSEVEKQKLERFLISFLEKHGQEYLEKGVEEIIDNEELALGIAEALVGGNTATANSLLISSIDTTSHE